MQYKLTFRYECEEYIMRKNKLLSIFVVVALLCSVLFNLASCFTVKAENLMEGIVPNAVTPEGDVSSVSTALADFALRLFKATENGENTLVSPLSVMYALAMTANGAEGGTLSEMESVLGMGREELNLYLYTYLDALPKSEKCKLSLANSIWFKDDAGFSVNHDFLQKNADYYGADVYKSDFDYRTLKDINNWTRNKTDGMIPKVLDEISKDAVMYLVNALAFEAEWSKVYKSSSVRDSYFTTEGGERQSVEMMYSTEGKYLEDEYATGFLKYYRGGKYAFAALLPNEGVSVSEYLDAIDGESLSALLSGVKMTTVHAAIPKFETEYSTEMSKILSDMGMPTAFDPSLADFTSLGSYTGGNIYINNVIHKTYIRVDEKGTKAGAVTVVEMNKATAGDPFETKQVYLDRPFVYMLIDCENNIPFFIGTTMSVK